MNDKDFELYMRTEWPNETELSWPAVRPLLEPKVIVIERNGHRLTRSAERSPRIDRAA